MDSTSKFLIILLIILSIDYFAYRIIKLIESGIKRDRLKTRQELNEIDKDLLGDRL